MLKIVEIFPSVQGEGLRQGSPAIFIRLAGCNLRCSFCDTKYAWEGGRQRTEAAVFRTVARIRKTYPAEWICLTGGEPLLQDVGPLIRRLKDDGSRDRPGRLKIQIETNGLFHPPHSVDWVTISPKPPAYAFRPEYRSLAREVKLVVSGRLSLAVLSGIRAAFPDRTPILLQLESNSPASLGRTLRLLKRALKAGLPNVRLAVQLHKWLNLP